MDFFGGNNMCRQWVEDFTLAIRCVALTCVYVFLVLFIMVGLLGWHSDERLSGLIISYSFTDTYSSRLEHSACWNLFQVLVVCKRVSWSGRLSHVTPAVKGHAHCWIFAEERHLKHHICIWYCVACHIIVRVILINLDQLELDQLGLLELNVNMFWKSTGIKLVRLDLWTLYVNNNNNNNNNNNKRTNNA